MCQPINGGRFRKKVQIKAIETGLVKIVGRYNKTGLYRAAGITRQGFEKQRKKQLKQEEQASSLKQRIIKAREQHKNMGSRVLYHYLGINHIGINKFEQFVSENGLNVRKLRKRIITTVGTYQEQDQNLTCGLALKDINQLIAGDITYLIFKEKKYYVFTLKDAYSKRIIGLYGSDNMMAINAVKTYQQARRLRGSALKQAIHHSDAGSQYKSNAYKKLLAKDDIKISIAGNCLENGMAEQFNSVLKNDYMIDNIKDVKHLNRVLTKIKHLINNERPVAALGYRTPVQFEKWIQTQPVEARTTVVMYDFTQAESGTFGKA